MHIANIRFGLATNSSSLHSLVFLPNNMTVKDYVGYADDDPEVFGDFGWNKFTIISDQMKLRYLSFSLRRRLHQELPYEIANMVEKSWVGELPFDMEDDNLDHQSLMRIPSSYGTKIPDGDFFNALKNYILQDNLAIIGGNDNEDNDHPLAEDNFHIPIPTDYRSDFICRFDEKYKYWTIFNKEDGTKMRLRFDVDPDHMDISPEKASTPELIDIKITDFCRENCKFCFSPETEVLTPFGPKQIQEMQIGDKVYSYNEDKKLRQEDTVTQLHQRLYDDDLVVIELEDGSSMSLTPNHEIFTQRGWIIADEIEENDELLKF